ncbi:hypothetical protein [Pendulispora albinea]|uniref:Uncharacterized protein n=1 Tax=Pendulispora albinea TaxID=2741071 RepID=A0ABZ2LWJ1_9BACT
MAILWRTVRASEPARERKEHSVEIRANFLPARPCFMIGSIMAKAIA